MRLAPGLALLVLLGGACTVNIEVDPTTGLESGEEAEGMVDDVVRSVLESAAADSGSGIAIDDTLDDVLGSGSAGSDTGNATGRASSALGADAPNREGPVVESYPPPTAAADVASTAPPPAGAAVTATDAVEPTATTSGSPDTKASESADTAATAPDTDTTPTASRDPEPAGSDPQAPATAEDLPGEPYEYGPAAGDSLAVVGVDHDDVLNVRDMPFGEIIATLGLANPIAFLLEVREMPSDEPIDWFDSWSGAIVATGRTRKLPTTVWHEVQVAGVTGWASGAYLAPIGLTDDITAHLIDRLGERPEAATLTDLALIAGKAFASSEPTSRVVVTVGPTIFEALGEVTVDVLNIGDDSLLGYRLHVFADPAGDWMSENPGPFTLRSVERTILCYSYRGVSPDGLCN